MIHADILLLHIPGLNCLWWLLLAMLLPLLLGLLLGYWLWYKYRRQAEDMRLERDNYHKQFTEMEAKYASLKYEYDELLKDNKGLRASLQSADVNISVLTGKLERAKAAQAQATDAQSRGGLSLASEGPSPVGVDYQGLFAMDNLQVVEGVGPKIEQILKGAGIGSWALLATQTPDDLRAILDQAGPAYKMQNPGTWPEQARLAADGKWDELVRYQKGLEAGRENPANAETPAKIEQLAARIISASEPISSAKGGLTTDRFAGIFSSDNLQVIEGVGPKLEETLRAAGFNNWATVALTSPQQLSDVLMEASPNNRIHDPATWPEQARLANEGKWEELVAYQKSLGAGREQEGAGESPSKVEKMWLSILGYSSADPEDLKIIEGIGPKIEQLLKDAGFKTWSDLGRATVDELRDVLSEAGDRYRLADPGTWPRQAALAAAGDWNGLRKYQDFLQGGRDPK